MKNYGTYTAIILVSLLTTLVANAGPAALTYQGRIVKGNGAPLEYSAVAFQFEILAPNKVCVLYREQLNHVDMTNSGGVFDVKIGSSHSYPSAPTSTVLDAFNNGSPMVCDGGSPYNPGLTDGRYLRVKFHDGSQWQTISPDNEIRTVPFSGFAASAATLGTHVATDFVTKNEVNGGLDCGAGSFLTWDSFNKVFGCSGVSGASGGTVQSVVASAGSNPYLTVSSDTVNPVVTLNVGTTAGTVAAGNDSRFTDSRAPTGPAGGSLSGTYPNPGLADNSVTTAKINDAAVTTEKLFVNPGISRLVMTDSSTGATLAPLSCSPGQLLTWNASLGWQCTNATTLAVGSATQATNFLGNLAGDVTGTQGATVVEKIKGYDLDFTAVPTTGQVLKFSASGKWVASNDSNAGGTVTNVSATAPLSVTNGGTTPQISIAKADNSTDGYLAASDWVVFSGKQNALGFTPLNPANNLSELTATATTARTNLGLGSAAVKNAPAAGNAAAAEVVLGNDSRLGDSRTPSGTAGGDLAGTYPNPTLAPIVTAGAGTKITYDAKGRVTASAGLAASDIPNLDWSKITSGTPTSLAGYGITDALVSNAGGTPSIQSGTDVTKPASPAAGAIYFASDTKVIYQYNSGAWVAIASSAGAGGTIAALTGDVTASGNGTVTATVNSVGGSTAAAVNTATVAANAATHLNTASAIVKRDASGNFAAGAMSAGSVVLRDSGSNTVTLQSHNTVTSSYVLRFPAAVGLANQVLTTDASGNLSWTSPAITSGVAVTSPIVNSGTAAAPNIGIQQANNTQAGYLSAADWIAFNSKQSTSLAQGKIFVGNNGGVATPVTPSGDVTMTDAGVFSVEKIRGIAVNGTAPSAAGQVLRYDGTSQYMPAFLRIADMRSTITPFGGVFANTACSTSQTMYYSAATDTFLCQNIAVSAANFANQAQNSVFAGPASGGAGAPAFRTLAVADLPTTVFVNDGNNFGGAATLGTNSNHALNFETNSNVRMTIANSGRVGIGTTGPVGNLSVEGTGAVGVQIKTAGAGSADTMNLINDMDATGAFWFAKGGTALAAPSVSDRLMNITNEGNVEIYGQNSNTASGVLGLKTQSGGTKNEVSMEFYADRSNLNTLSGYMGYRSGTALDMSITNIHNASLILGTNNANRVVVNGAGRVGIGNDNPQAALHITEKTDGWESSFRMDRSWESTVDYFQMMYDYQGLKIMTMADDANEAHIIFKPKDLEAMRIAEGGNVGINVIVPSEKLEVGGNVKATAYLYTSDARLKKDVVTLPQALEKLLRLRGVNFVWKNNEEKTVGFIAQEVEAIYPELVKTDKVSGFKSVQYGNITAILVEALKQEHAERLQDRDLCQSQIQQVSRGLASVQDSSESRIQKLEQENQDLKLRLERLEKALLNGK